MTAEFAPTAGITKVLVAGVASSRKVQAINTAYGLAVDKTVIAARTEAKRIPILAGSAATNAQLHEVETAMRKANVAESL
ncbi:hypothetical protein D6D21_08068 [Aureobasidium pullulans]|uniref:Uncharacterized protein n=1 Tax=Aureobasidium pullulans TaxID=5580 RepID=A0A4S9Z6U7_AURPU|nr:hypothetical protein D6D21_08068 [Aureobasidium pullulans]THX33475.1 hypothetical protein D6D10_07833 [Aureobasidium pullulans]TIA02381.1 hypothetical protein D6C82_02797 [Aureobasidium pullulans]